MREIKSIELLGRKVELSERNAFDVLELMKFVESRPMDANLASFVNARVIEDSLQFYFSKVNFIKRFFLKRKFTTKKLIKLLSSKELGEYAMEVLTLEGVDVKKKVAEQEAPSVEKSQGA